jgi:hypothetical protein
MAAVRQLAYEAADSGVLSPDLDAGIHRTVPIPNWMKKTLDPWLTGEVE